MDDPCVRKSTNPLPVTTSLKRASEGDSKTVKKGKFEHGESLNINNPVSILEEDLNLSNDDEEVIETEKSVQGIIDIMISEVLKEDKIPDEPIKTVKKKFTSKEFILSSDEEVERDKCDSQKQESVKQKQTVLIEPKKKNQCRYIFVKKPKKGERCTNLTDSTFCIIHKKNYEKSQNLNKPTKIEEKIRDLQFTTQELNSKVDHIITKCKGEESKNYNHLKTKCDELELKLEKMTKKMKDTQQRPAVKEVRKSIHKLNKKQCYRVTSYDGKRGIKLVSDNKIIHLKMPKEMKCPEHYKNKSFKFNTDKNIFEFV